MQVIVFTVRHSQEHKAVLTESNDRAIVKYQTSGMTNSSHNNAKSHLTKTEVVVAWD